MKNTISKSPEILFFIAPDQVCSLPSSTFAHRRSQRRPNILCRHLDHKKKTLQWLSILVSQILQEGSFSRTPYHLSWRRRPWRQAFPRLLSLCDLFFPCKKYWVGAGEMHLVKFMSHFLIFVWNFMTVTFPRRTTPTILLIPTCWVLADLSTGVCSYQRIQRCKEDFYKNSIKNGSGDYYGDFFKPRGIELIAVDTSGHDDSWPAIEGDRSTAMLGFFL